MENAVINFLEVLKARTEEAVKAYHYNIEKWGDSEERALTDAKYNLLSLTSDPVRELISELIEKAVKEA